MKKYRFRLNLPIKIISIIIGIINAVFAVLFSLLVLVGLSETIIRLDPAMFIFSVSFILLAALNFLFSKKLLSLNITSWKSLILGTVIPVLETGIIYKILEAAVLGLMNIG